MTWRRATAPALALLALLALLQGCQFLPREPVEPLAQERHANACGRPVDTLLVLLPGVYDRPGEFAREGLVQAVATAGIAADTVAVDLHRAYYDNGSAVERLHADVIAPARAAGYRRVWIAGISLGGLGALLHAAEGRGGVDGLVLLAPYLGEPAQLAPIQAAGLAAWQAPAPAGVRSQGEAVAAAWRWLQGHAAAGRPPVWLGAGADDRFGAAHRLLAASLPPGRSVTVPGGHDWPAWRAAWSQLLPLLGLPGCG